MKFSKYIALFFALSVALVSVQCDDDENGNVIDQPTCDDGIQNGDEEGVDCGGSCPDCLEGIDFTGTWVQEDIVGRPAVNAFFGGSDNVKNMFNITQVSDRADFRVEFEATLEQYHDIYGDALDLQLDYETNILGLDAVNFTSLLAEFDALQVAPNGETRYYDPNTGTLLTGRRPSDDVVDFTLTLMFGGLDGFRFDGTDDSPFLISDGVDAGDRDFELPFPYLENPIEQ
jgi:hypothetical protein